MIAEIEGKHAVRFSKLLKIIQNNGKYEYNEDVYWLCLSCGYIHKGKEPLKGCPVCLETNPFVPLDFDWWGMRDKFTK